ncbi:MAG: AAA family ATPase [Pelovirga sp.]
MDMHRQLIKNMLDPGFYDHPADTVELIETHISWIFLAGDYAYKMKKPLDLGFLDFSTLDKRKFYCEEELRLNRQLAEELYLAVVPVGGTPPQPRLGGDPPLAYLVKMRRFPQQNQFDRLLAAGELTTAQLRSCAATIAACHRRCARAAAGSPFGTPAAILAPALENFEQIRPVLPHQDLVRQVDRLLEWTRQTFAGQESRLLERRQAGFIREVHGDLHLANIAWVNDRALLFDRIEFSENLRWIDTMNDIAFLTMDLADHGEKGLAAIVLDSYLQHCADYAGLPLLPFYQVYRAMVRAKVICLRAAQPGLTAAEAATDRALVRSYLDLAEAFTRAQPRHLIITHGLSGSGKSTLCRQLVPLLEGICLQSDRERKRLHGLQAEQASSSPVAGGLYSAAAGSATYARLRDLAALVLAADGTVMVDATFIRLADRQRMRDLAAAARAPLIILDFQLPQESLRQRIRQRKQQQQIVSEADEEVLEHQLRVAQPLTSAEQKRSIRITATTSAANVAAAIRAFHPGGPEGRR